MSLEIGQTYKNNDGETLEIGGLTKRNPNWVWSIQGNWYDKETGAFIRSYSDGRQEPLPTDSRHSVSNHAPKI